MSCSTSVHSCEIFSITQICPKKCLFFFLLGPQSCSLGQLVCPLDESDRLSVRGTYFLPDEVSCNGSLVSVYTCFFYSDAGNMSNTTFQFHVGVFRQMGDNYTQISQFAVTWMRVDSSETQSCVVVNMGNLQQVLEGDKLAVHVRQKCRNNGVCPLQPILRTSSSVSVFFIRRVNVTDIPVTRFDKRRRYTNVYLDVSASIGKFCNIGSIGLS